MTTKVKFKSLAGRLGAVTALLVISILIGAPSSSSARWPEPSGGWTWPTGSTSAVLRAFDPPAQRWLPGHRGVDLQAEVGSPIYAPTGGTVVYAGTLVNRPVISVLIPSGLRLTFEPVEPIVAAGDTVKVGQQIGVLVAGHSADALHWGAKFSDDHYVDPLSLLWVPVRLKPWDG